MGGSTAFDFDWVLPSATSDVRTMVLVGRTGNGKSATGNSILGRREFNSKSSSAGVTSSCELKRTVLEDGKILNFIDTPGLFDCSGDPKYVGKELAKCSHMVKGGIHALLVVLSARSRFSKEEEAAVKSLLRFFGSNISSYMIVVFTGGDDVEDFDDYFCDCPQPLMEVLKICEYRHVLFDNKTQDDSKKSEQLKQLISLVDYVVDQNDGNPFTNNIFLELKEAMKLSDGTEEANSSKGYSKEEISIMKEYYKSYEDLLKYFTEMLGARLKELMERLEKQLEAERAARIVADEESKAAKIKFEEEIMMVRVKLEEVMEEVARKKKGCVIM